MKKIIWIVFFILLMSHQGQALIILTNKAINFNEKKSGIIKGNVVLGNKIQKAIATGKYKVSSNGKDVVFNISAFLSCLLFLSGFFLFFLRIYNNQTTSIRIFIVIQSL